LGAEEEVAVEVLHVLYGYRRCFPSPGENKEKGDLGEYWEVERSKGFGSEGSKESEGSLQKDRRIDLRENEIGKWK
jgi:hypothetical protein